MVAADMPHRSRSETRESTHAADSPLARVIRNSAWNALGMLLTLSLNFVSIFLLARRLGKEMLGIYFAVFSLAIVIHFIFEGGITTVLTRRIAREPEKLKQHVAESNGLLLVVSLGSLLALLACGMAWSFVRPESIGWSIFFLAGVAVAGRQLLEFSAAAFRGLERFEFENLSRVVQTFLFCAGVVLLVPEGESGLMIALLAFTTSNVVAGVLLAALLATKWNCRGITLRPAVLRDWLGESIPLGFGDTLRRLIWQVDTLMLGVLQPAAVVGLYSLAYRPLQPLQLVPRTIASVTFPTLSRLAHDDMEALSRVFARSLNVLWIVSLPLCLVITFCARPLIVIPAGEAYAEAVPPLQLLIWMITLIFITTQLRFLFTALGEQRVYWRLTLGVLVAKLLLELLLIPVWGLYGACAGTVVGELVLAVAGLWVAHQLGVGPLRWGAMSRALLAAALVAALLWPLRDQALPVLIAASIAGCGLYLGLCLLFCAIERQELLRFMEVSRGMLSRLADRRRRTVAEGSSGERASCSPAEVGCSISSQGSKL